MGIWGPGLYDNDCTADVRDTFQQLLANGIRPEKAAKMIREENADMFRDSEDGPLSELALREQLFLFGALKEKERIETIAYLESGGDYSFWQENNPDLSEGRSKEILRLTLLFRSPPPKTCKTKNGVGRTKYNWKKGQGFAIPITGDVQVDFQGEYILLYVCGEAEKVDRFSIPEVYVKLTKGKVLPRNEQEFDMLDYVQISCTSMEERFCPFKCIEDIPEAYQQDYFPDAWGYLPEYTMVLYEAAGNHPPDSMIYLGCMDNVSPPFYNYRKYRALNGTAWDYLQEFVLQRYCLHNLRQAEFYKR